jgi:hypothetical protein
MYYVNLWLDYMIFVQMDDGEFPAVGPTRSFAFQLALARCVPGGLESSAYTYPQH